jgi:hypothetical protein
MLASICNVSSVPLHAEVWLTAPLPPNFNAQPSPSVPSVLPLNPARFVRPFRTSLSMQSWLLSSLLLASRVPLEGLLHDFLLHRVFHDPSGGEYPFVLGH